MVDIHPSYGVGSMDPPDLKQGTSLQGIVQERLGVVLFKKSKRNDFNLFLPLPYVCQYCLSAVNNGNQNSIRCWWRAL